MRNRDGQSEDCNEDKANRAIADSVWAFQREQPDLIIALFGDFIIRVAALAIDVIGYDTAVLAETVHGRDARATSK